MEHGTPLIKADIEGEDRSLIVDTGSDVSILQPGISRANMRSSTLRPYGVTGETLDVRGKQKVALDIGGKKFDHTFLVCPLPTEAAGLLGTDFLDERSAHLNFEKGEITLNDAARVNQARSDAVRESRVLTIFTLGKEGHSPQPKLKTRDGRNERINRDPRNEERSSQGQTWLAKACENIVLAPRCRHVIVARLETEKDQNLPPVVYVEPAQIPIEGIFPARTLCRVNPSTRQSPQQISRCIDTGKRVADSAYVMLANFSEETLTVPKHTVLGVAQPVSEVEIEEINARDEPKKNSPCGKKENCRNEVLYKKLLTGKVDHLSIEDRRHIEPVLTKYAHVFHDENVNDFKCTNVVQHEIQVGDSKPIRKPPYRTPYALRQEMQTQVQKMLDKEVIRPSNSPWSAPAILVPKKKGPDGKPRYRFCVDFRALNSVTRFDPYPLPLIEEATSALHGSKYFSVLDCYSGFWQMGIREEHKELTGFSVPSGHYEFNRLPFGLSNSPANFQRLMDTVLKNLTGTECFVFIDDVIIFSNTAEEHARRLESVLQRFDQANLQLHPGKCAFAQPQVQYLGYVLSEQGATASPEKVKAVQNFPTPKCVKDIRSFLGLASFYRRLVPKFAEIAKPLTTLTRKDQPFAWGPEQQEALVKLKNKLSTAPVLAFPDFSLPFILTTDASKNALGAILSQVQEGAEKPIAYASRQTNKAERSYSATEAEMLALVWATKQFRCYLHGRKFVARTDHAALKYLRNFADQNSRLMRWSIRLSELDFSVEHRAGAKIAHVDALSRCVGTIAQGGTLDKEEVLREQAKDEFCLKQAPGTYGSRKEFFLDEDGVLYRRRSKGEQQLIVPATLVPEVIRQNHDPVYAAHPGTKRTHDLIALHFWWPGMRKAITEYVRRCDPCQKRKGNNEFVAPLGDVQAPTAPFQVTAMDITGPYKVTPRGNKYLLTFIDHFSKYVEAFPIADQTAETCGRVYATQIVARHGTGAQLITDQGRAFMSSFFQETCRVLGIRRTRTTSYHPASNGVIERWHRDLHTGMSHYINASNTNWDTLIPFFLMAHRATPHTVTGYSPFYLLHGREMQLPSNDSLRARCTRRPTSQDRRIENLKASLRRAYKTVAKANRKAHQTNKKFYDRRAKTRGFVKSDFVYLYTPATKVGQSKKFQKFWTGPYQVTRKISELNYEIADRDDKRSIVHVNRLKRCYGQGFCQPKRPTGVRKKPQVRDSKRASLTEEREGDIRVGTRPLLLADDLTDKIESATPRNPTLDTPDTGRRDLDTPSSSRSDPSYQPLDTPRSRRELQTTRAEPPITRSRARNMLQDGTEA